MYDVMVVGSGGAGLRAAIGAAGEGMRTLLVTKGKTDRSGCTLLAGSNVSADIGIDGKSMSELGISDRNKGDSKEAWFQDIIHQGFYINNEKLVRLYVDTAVDRVAELMDWGIDVKGLEGSREISVYGKEILDTLYSRLRGYNNVDIMEDAMITDVVVEDGTVKGAIIFDIIEGEAKYIPARSVILASGGAHNLFYENDGPTDNCGEGQAAALRAGAELIDMEMVSFCPTIMMYPTIYKGNMLPYVLLGHGAATLRNRFGETFTHRHLGRYGERLALETEWDKMLLSYAIESEIKEGNGAMHGGVYMALNNTPTNVRDELESALPALTRGIYADIMKLFDGGRGICVAPNAHYFDGGIRIASDTSTGVAGLYAAGECTGGVFGSNRVSAATTEMLIEGAEAAKRASEYARGASAAPATRDCVGELMHAVEAPFEKTGGYETQELIRELHAATAKGLPVIRNEADMKDALGRIGTVSEKLGGISFADRSRKYNREWLEYLALRNMTLTAAAMVKSALLRRESRGVHIREDCLYTDNDNYLGNIIIENAKLDHRMEKALNSMASGEKGRTGYNEYVEQTVRRLSE